MLRFIKTGKLILELKGTAKNGFIILENQVNYVSLFNQFSREFSENKYTISEYQKNTVHRRLKQADDSADIGSVDFPWTISYPIYGDEGLKSYGKLLIPTGDEITTFVVYSAKYVTELSYSTADKIKNNTISPAKLNQTIFETLKLTSNNTNKLANLLCACGKNGLAFIADQSKAMSIIVIGKSKVIALFIKSKNNEITPILVNKYKKVTPIVFNRCRDIGLSLLSKGNDIAPFLKKKVYNNENIINAFLILKIKSSEFPSVVKNRTSSVISSASKIINSSYFNRPMELNVMSKEVMNKSKEYGSKVASLPIFIHSKNYLKKTIDILNKAQIKRDYTYVDKYFNRGESKGQNVLVKPATQIIDKKDFHSSASQITKHVDFSFSDYPYYIIVLSNFEKDLIEMKIPEPLKKTWHGLRDKTLPELQGTISSILQKLQDLLLKKK